MLSLCDMMEVGIYELLDEHGNVLCAKSIGGLGEALQMSRDYPDATIINRLGRKAMVQYMTRAEWRVLKSGAVAGSAVGRNVWVAIKSERKDGDA
jgi:allophanate hydrolase subunit 1